MRDLEHKHQVALFQWAELNRGLFPELEWMHAVPNGGARHPAVAVKLKKEGVKAGVVDIFLDVPRGGFHGFRAELKVGNNKATKDQARWIKHYLDQGYHAGVYTGWEAVREALIGYLNQQGATQ